LLDPMRRAQQSILRPHVGPNDRKAVRRGASRSTEGARPTLRALAREVGGLDHAYLSRMLSGKAAVNVDHVRRISRFLGLADDYFPEVREADVIDAIRADPELRDKLHGSVVRRQGRGGAD
jgi:hypothetical protein